MDGQAHATASLVAALPVALLAAKSSGAAAGVGAAIGCGLVGLIMTPDMDVDDITDEEWRIIRMFGPFGAIGWLWVAYWWPYAWAFSHRSFWSHAPVIGTAIRAVYLLWWFPLVARWQGWQIPPEAWPVLAGAFVGLCVSDALHWLFDGIPARRKARAKV